MSRLGSSDHFRPGLRVVTDAEGSPFPKASLVLRGLARVVDVAVAWGLYKVTGPAGPLIAMLYLLFADGMIQGQSPGKKMLGVKVIHLPTRAVARYRDSLLRNAPFGLVVLLWTMPDLGRIAFAAGVVAIGGIEALKIVRDPLGLRLGDSWAQTQVIDGKVVAGSGLLRPPEPTRTPGRVMMQRDDDSVGPGAPNS